MQLFELKRQHTETLDKADNIIEAAGRASRKLTETENERVQTLLGEAKAMGERIKAVESRNTLRLMDGEGGLSSAHRTANAPAQGKGLSLAEAVSAASKDERAQITAFENYLSGDMTAVADLTPTGGGGVFIPSLVVGVVARNYAAFSPVRQYANIWATEGGEPTTFPVISDSEAAIILQPAALTGADYIVSGDAPPTSISGPVLHAHKFSSKPVFCPRETMTDANISVMEEMLSALLARIARTENLKYTKGTGTNEPRGFLADAVAYSAGSSSAELSLDVALDLAYSVPAMYRPAGVYMASDITIKYLRKLKDDIGTALWKDAFEEGNATLGTPARLHGYPIIVNNDMDSVSADGTFAGVSPLAFGDFKRFVVRDAENGAPFVYRYDVPAKDGGAVIAFKRSDSKLVVAEAISKLTV